MNQITPRELRRRLELNQPLHLIDVRAPQEHNDYNIGGSLIPLADLFNHKDSIPKDIPVVIYCKMGIRSQIAIQRLEEKFGYHNLINLEGGMERWKRETGK